MKLATSKIVEILHDHDDDDEEYLASLYNKASEYFNPISGDKIFHYDEILDRLEHAVETKSLTFTEAIEKINSSDPYEFRDNWELLYRYNEIWGEFMAFTKQNPIYEYLEDVDGYETIAEYIEETEQYDLL